MAAYQTVRYIKKDGVLKPVSLTQAKEKETFVSKLPDGVIVEAFYEMQQDDGTLPQLAKIHVMIRELATHIGESVQNLKLLIKDRAGLCIAREVSGKEYFLAKSFGDCSKEELALAIQAAIEIGEEVNFPLY